MIAIYECQECGATARIESLQNYVPKCHGVPMRLIRRYTGTTSEQIVKGLFRVGCC